MLNRLLIKGVIVCCLSCLFISHTSAIEPCIDGHAGAYPCHNIDLLSYIPISSFSAGNLNDIWGWTDPATGNEYAILGLDNGTAFIDVSDPENPVYLGILPTRIIASPWRDIKVYQDHAYIVSEALLHGMQVFDLKRLKNVTSPPQSFTADATFTGFQTAHNIVINEDSGMAYAVGSDQCSGGLYTIDIRDKQNPEFVGCYDGDGYVHDAQCVTYSGPDSDYQGQEICVGLNEDSVTIVDMTNPASGVLISRTEYAGSNFTHQGWFTADQAYFLTGDEGDEIEFMHNTRTYVWDLQDLDNPLLKGYHEHETGSIDHNLYIANNLVYQANYTSGLRVLGLRNLPAAVLTEIAFFDTYPQDDSNDSSGLWSVYPFFNSGTIIVSDIGQGLFVLRADVPDTDYDGTGNEKDTDDDNDGMPDEFEIIHGLDTEDPGDANLDNDADGSSNLDEYLLGRHPLVNEPAILLIILNNDE